MTRTAIGRRHFLGAIGLTAASAAIAAETKALSDRTCYKIIFTKPVSGSGNLVV